MFRTPAPELDMRVGWRAPELVRTLVDPLKVGRRRRVVTMSTRIALHAVGAVVIAVCVAVMLWNDIGPGPLDVFIAAVRTRTGLPLMFALWATIGALTLLAWALGRRPGFGTVLGPIVVGPTMQLVLHRLEQFDPPSSMVVRIAIQFLAVGVVGVGVGAIGAGRLGSGTGELLAAATSDRSGHPEQRARMVLEVSWLAVGVLLGGPIGFGTVVVALCIGKSIANGRRIVDSGIAASRRQIAAALPRLTVVRFGTVKVHLVDGTYELFRQHFGSRRGDMEKLPGEWDATIGVLASSLQLIDEGATHLGVASDHVIESFRNELWAGYKTSEGMPPELVRQIPVMEQALVAMGVTTWAMVEWEADDALGAAAHVADADERVEQVLIVTPDKDLGQCVKGQRVVQYDRRKRELIDEAGVVAKFGVGPASIPDYLGLVGDTADGFPGLPGWGAKSAAAVLARYSHLEQIPAAASLWEVPGLRGAGKLSATLQENMELALLFRIIATVDRDVPVGTVDDWEWKGPTPEFAEIAQQIGAPNLVLRANALAKSRS